MELEDDELDIIGTAVEPLDEDEIPAKKLHKDDKVFDEKGRQRFHGAFTGGFSAGYFNSVGSKEGWAPSSYLSSRSKKAENMVQQPEDFMDDEDFGQFGIAPRKIQATSQFDNSSAEQCRKRDLPQLSEGPIPGEPPLKDLVKPVSESIGVQLLKKMGWRPGWGVGQRVKKKKKSKIKETSSGEKVYGCSLPPDGSGSEEEDPFAASFTFAPEDVNVLPYSPKDNLHGIGYVGLDRNLVLTAPIGSSDATVTKAQMEKGKKKLSIMGQAFGVGILEDEDEDIYTKDDMSQYDFCLGGDLPQKVQKGQQPYDSKLDVFRVGKVLDGFHLATKPQHEKKMFPPPSLPSNFTPVHKALKTVDGKQNELSHNKFLGRHTLTVEERGTLLGERKIVEADSVLNKTPEEKVALETGKQEQSLEVPSTSQESLSTSTFKPFATNEDKQLRYEQYLKLVDAGKKDCLGDLQPSSMTEWEKQREKEEFQRAASLYRPMSTFLDSRFVSGKQLENDREMVEDTEKKEEKSDQEKAIEMKMFGHLTREKFEWRPAALLCRRFNVPNPYPHSSFVGLTKVKQDKVSIFNFLTVPAGSHPPQVESNRSSASHTNANKNIKEEPDSVLSGKNPSDELHDIIMPSDSAKDLDINQDAKNKKESKDTEKSVDLFKMIFQDSSDDSSESEKDEKSNENEESKDTISVEVTVTENQDQNENQVSSKDDEEKNNEDKNNEDKNNEDVNSVLEKPKRPATGVFANLDLDNLNKRSSDCDLIEVKVEDKNMDTDECKQESSQICASSELYGPKLPPGPLLLPEKSSRRDHKKSKHRKEKHKHKHKKYKTKKSRHKSKHSHKHSKKKHTSNHNASDTGESSNRSSSSDEEETSSVHILQKVHELQKSGRFRKS